MNELVQEALAEYEFTDPQLSFIRHNENITYKIDDNDKNYVLRIKKPVEGFTSDIFGTEITAYELMEDEMMMIEYARNVIRLALQKPIRNRKGKLVSRLSDGSPACLLVWVEGDVLNEKTVTSTQAVLLGKMAAQLQRGLHGQEYIFKRFSYTVNLIQPMKEQLDDAAQNGQITKEKTELMKTALHIIESRMLELDAIQGMKGMLHADLGLSNVIVTETDLIPIDFSLSGYGYYFMDVAMMMSQFKDKKIRWCIKQGYEQESNKEVPAPFIDAFFALGVLLYICCQHNRVWKEDWFSETINRWCNTIFIPLIKGTEYVL